MRMLIHVIWSIKLRPLISSLELSASRGVCLIYKAVAVNNENLLVILNFYSCSCSHLSLPRCMECRRGLAMRFQSVCPSVRLSVKRVHCDKREEKSVQILYRAKDHLV